MHAHGNSAWRPWAGWITTGHAAHAGGGPCKRDAQPQTVYQLHHGIRRSCVQLFLFFREQLTDVHQERRGHGTYVCLKHKTFCCIQASGTHTQGLETQDARPRRVHVLIVSAVTSTTPGAAKTGEQHQHEMIPLVQGTNWVRRAAPSSVQSPTAWCGKLRAAATQVPARSSHTARLRPAAVRYLGTATARCLRTRDMLHQMRSWLTRTGLCKRRITS